MAGSAILTVNAGSSSLKIGVFVEEGGGFRQRVHGDVQNIATADAKFKARDPEKREIADFGWPVPPSHEDVLARVLPWARSQLAEHVLIAVGHRVVHGGRHLTAPARVDDQLMAAMTALVPLAPLHQPHCLAAIRAVSMASPGLPQVACFDTAFHRTMPEVARRFAIPRALHDEGVERYGFHGLSYDYVAGRLRQLEPSLAQGRVVVAHLGNGASLCALLAGRSVDTTMGMTALDGLPMGTRCGAIDPGVLLYLLQEKQVSVAALEDLLYHHSGLLGVSGESSDMRALEKSGNDAAREAIELFAYQIARQCCLMAGALGGLDGLVFTAGIGEHAPGLREAVCGRLAWLGVAIDPAQPGNGERRISTASSRVAVWVIPTDEEAVIAQQTAKVVQGA